MFAVHAKGASNLSPLRTFGPAGRQPSSPQGLSISRQPPKGVHFRRPQGGCMVFPRAKPGCKGFIQTGAFYKFRGALHNPRARGASNLRTLGATAPSNFRTLTPDRACPQAHLQKNADIPLIGPFSAHPALPAAKIYPMILVPFTDFLGIKNAICDDHLMGIALAR